MLLALLVGPFPTHPFRSGAPSLLTHTRDPPIIWALVTLFFVYCDEGTGLERQYVEDVVEAAAILFAEPLWLPYAAELSSSYAVRKWGQKGA